jgi:hypothetical protein
MIDEPVENASSNCAHANSDEAMMHHSSPIRGKVNTDHSQNEERFGDKITIAYSIN